MDQTSQANTYTYKIIRSGSTGAIYGLGFIGALVYYFQQANTFWVFVEGFLKALVWPAFLIHELFSYLHM